MRKLLYDLYWAVLFLLVLAGGFLFLDAVAASGSAQNLIRDMGWPVRSEVNCDYSD